jgi:hypothetical protein
LTDLQEQLCQMAEDNYESKIEEIMDLEILRINGEWVYVPDDVHGEVAILLETLI